MKIKNEFFSIFQICRSGQCFRLNQMEQDRYELMAGDRFLEIRTSGEETELCCQDEEYEVFWKNYFDLDADYGAYFSRIPSEDSYLSSAADFGCGIRILRQDVWEMIVTFILSQQNNIPRIKGLIKVLCQRYGEKKKGPDGRVYDAFPTPERLAGVTEEELRSLKFGYRSKYLCGTVKCVLEKRIDLGALYEMDARRAQEELMKLPGIGGKVADCIRLFALHQMDAFPIDTHIRKVLAEHYADGFPFERYPGCAGLMQQYIFYYDLMQSR
ncbi:MAG: DNA glycosylase [Eubacteriales bacterium]|nr:DNA glycosylase [Eubacteriales bacterium]